MTVRRRLVPLSEITATLDLLEARGFDLRTWTVDIGTDYVRLTPPANSNAGGDIGKYINRPAHRPQAGEKR